MASQKGIFDDNLNGFSVHVCSTSVLTIVDHFMPVFSLNEHAGSFACLRITGITTFIPS